MKQGPAQTVNIAPEIFGFIVQSFWRDVVRRAPNCALGFRLGCASQTKVHNFRRSRIGKKNVRRFNVAMNQTLRMRSLQTFRHLDCSLQNFRFGKLLPLFDGIVETPLVD